MVAAAPAVAWSGTLLKNGGRLCCVSIANRVTKHGVYEAGDTVTEPEAFDLAEGVNGGKPLQGGITVAAGDAGINVVARGDMSKMLTYVLSKKESQYFVLEMHTATEQKYWKPPMSDRDEAKAFVMSLREKPRAGMTFESTLSGCSALALCLCLCLCLCLSSSKLPAFDF